MPEAHPRSPRRGGLGLFLLWLLAFRQLSLVTKLRALDPGPCDSSPLPVLRMLSNLMHCLLNWRFERLAIVCLRPRPKGRVVCDSKRLASSDGRGT